MAFAIFDWPVAAMTGIVVGIFVLGPDGLATFRLIDPRFYWGIQIYFWRPVLTL